jgi:hypothetical protein
MSKQRKPRTSNFFGGRSEATVRPLGTWLEPEELCYPNGGMTRYAAAINVKTGRLNTVKCGIPDTFFSVPAKGGFLTTSDGGILRFHPRAKESSSEVDN